MSEDNENTEATPPKKPRYDGTPNLIKITTKERAKELGSRGGKASQEAYKRKKEALKLMKDIYLDIISGTVNIGTNRKKQEVDFNKFLAEAVKKVITQGGSPAVSMMRELREGTDGSTMNVTGTLQTIVEMTPEERERRIKELEERRNAQQEPEQKPIPVDRPTVRTVPESLDIRNKKEKPSDKTE
jgi:hypothetical protein